MAKSPAKDFDGNVNPAERELCKLDSEFSPYAPDTTTWLHAANFEMFEILHNIYDAFSKESSGKHYVTQETVPYSLEGEIFLDAVGELDVQEPETVSCGRSSNKEPDQDSTSDADDDDDDTMSGGHGDHGGNDDDDDTMSGGGNHGGNDDDDDDDTMSGGHGDHGGSDDDDDDTMSGGHGDHGGNDDDDDGDDTMSGGGGGHSGGHDGHGGGGHDHSDPDITPPGVGASQSAINAYVQALANAPDGHSHSSDSGKAGEHEAAMELVDRGEATHVAIGDGDWFDPNIWSNGEVPGADAKVLIPHGVHVNYAGVSDASLHTVRIDGTLDFATDQNSQMIFDTMVSSATGHLIIGTDDDPVQANVDVDLIVADNGRIDTNWDPMLLSRGIIAHGTTTIHGADKDSHEKVTDDPMEGDTSVKFAEVPAGWQVGDTIVIAGTRFDGYKWDNAINDRRLYPPEDEERVITRIDDDGRIHFEDPLVHDHDTPRADLKTSVANYTRNVSVESENAEDLEVFERGHVMFMHSDNVDVRYAEFHELGRTDKSEEARDISNIDNIRYDSNVQGRYSLHLHRTGTNDIDNPTVLEGNAVYGSPGWGIVHHDSNAVITNNATFDTFGAGYVAETGNETGVWDDNIAIWAEGVLWAKPKNTSEIGGDIFDTARGGEGFWFQGRMVASTNNVAASVNNGFVYFHRDGDGRMIDFDASLFDYDAALNFDETTNADDVPILGFQGNEAFAAREGLHVVKANPNQGHDVWSHLKDFTAWSVQNGVHLEYTSHYVLEDFDIIGKDPTRFSDPENGISIGNSTTEIVIIRPTIEGFSTGIDLNKFFTETRWEGSPHDYVVIDPDISNVDRDYANYDSSRDRILDSDDISERPVNLTIDGTINYSSGSTIYLEGTKSDSLGSVDFPGGTDTFRIRSSEMANVLENTGYWTTSSGQDYTLLDIYLTDRLTGDIYYETHPVYLSSGTAGRGLHADAQFNGTQNFSTVGGQRFAGDQILDTAIPATPTSGIPYSVSDFVQTLDEPSALEDSWLDGYDGDNTLSIRVDDGLFFNTGDATNVDLQLYGGEAVIAANNGQMEMGSSRSIEIVGSEASVGFDGTNGQTAILDFDQGSNLAFFADEDGLGTIQEFDSSGIDGPPDVLSGIDLGHSSLTIELSGLSPEAATQFVLMDADEIIGIFEEAVVGGLGARDAAIVVDYLQDIVTLELTDGEGVVVVETIGSERDGDDFAVLFDLMRADQEVVEYKPDNHLHAEDIDEEQSAWIL